MVPPASDTVAPAKPDPVGDRRKAIVDAAELLRVSRTRAAVKQRLSAAVATLKAETTNAPIAEEGTVAVRVTGSADAKSPPVPLPNLTVALLIDKVEVATDVTDVFGRVSLVLPAVDPKGASAQYRVQVRAGDGSEVAAVEGDRGRDRVHTVALGPLPVLVPHLAAGSAWMKTIEAVEQRQTEAAQLIDARLDEYGRKLKAQLAAIDRRLEKAEKVEKPR